MESKKNSVAGKRCTSTYDPPSRKRARRSLDRLNPCEINDNGIPEYVSCELNDRVPDIMEDLGVNSILASAVQSYIPLAAIKSATVHLITHTLLAPLRCAIMKRFPNSARIYYDRYAELFKNDNEEDSDNGRDDDNVSRRDLLLECQSDDDEESVEEFVSTLDRIRGDLIDGIVRKINDPDLMRVSLPQTKKLKLCLRIYAFAVSCIKPPFSTFLIEDDGLITDSFKTRIV
uniref:Wsv310-like protein n=1 Tax=Melicertus latisulcatus pemonivirus TaxID=2984278 RepID=A0A9C7BZE0_9VIRU|nr:MAG: wsv310-like protein [Melicertus latisulcatus pemonivirus]